MEKKASAERPPSARRRFPRYPLDIRITMQLFRNGEMISLWGRTNEMGRDGIGATLTGQLLQGEVVSMELTLPRTSRAIKIRALVRYRDGLRHGFEFLALTADQRKIVDDACAMLSGE
jgi:PilZ domain